MLAFGLLLTTLAADGANNKDLNSKALDGDEVLAAPAPSVTFTDIAAGDGAGITYRRTASASEAAYQAVKERSIVDADDDGVPDAPLTAFEIPTLPLKSRGAPGVALLDFDLDGDLDIYATNGPGSPNSLYANQLKEQGQVVFVDVAIAAGVAATDQDSTGTCFGDLDNDGDPDLYVLGNSEPNRLFENQGDGTFVDITTASNSGAGSFGSMSCSLGDVDGDGLLDIAIANGFDMSAQFAIFVDPFAFNQHNQLLHNDGGNTFTEISASVGLRDLAGFPPEHDGAAGITWALALVDYDLDGDVDLFTAEDQAAILPTREGGVDRGYIHLFRNDGSGTFTDIVVEADLDHFGAWMGLDFGDLDHDGTMDFFASNLGDFMWQILPPPFFIGDLSSRWYLGRGDGTFDDPGVGDLVVTPFGWGTAVVDYDMDGDTDIVYHGGMDFIPGIDVSNPGAVLRNDGSGYFSRDSQALAGSTDHTRRVVGGMATGDLDGDGFIDIVSVSSEDTAADTPLVLYPAATGGPFAPESYFIEMFTPLGSDTFTWSGLVNADGTLSVELNSGNRNRKVAVDLLGTVGLTTGGASNRDGIGAVVRFQPKHGATAMRPVTGGSSHASQHSLTSHFGLGHQATQGTLEVLWPGGVRNRLYKVRKDERILFPEIPCSFDGAFPSAAAYQACVDQALAELVGAGLLSSAEVRRFAKSARQAYDDPDGL